jgi:hypothetical protein
LINNKRGRKYERNKRRGEGVRKRDSGRKMDKKKRPRNSARPKVPGKEASRTLLEAKKYLIFFLEVYASKQLCLRVQFVISGL